MKSNEFIESTGGQKQTISGFPVVPVTIGGAVDEAIGLDAPHKRLSRDFMQSYADRIKTGTKKPKDKGLGILHGSNIKAIVKSGAIDENGDPTDIWDLDDLARQITVRPKNILDAPNAKLKKSAGEGELALDLTLPALAGIIIDEDTGEFVQIRTCPGAGSCINFCYALKGGYAMFAPPSMSSARLLNFLINKPEEWFEMVRRDIGRIKAKLAAQNSKLVVRWHDAGDFFSKSYFDMAIEVAKSYPDVDFYAYTKVAKIALSNPLPNFEIQHSSGANSREVKVIKQHIASGGVVKQTFEVPKEVFRDLIITNPRGKAVKDQEGRTQFKDVASWDEFKNRIAKTYSSQSSLPIDPNTIISYDQMLKIPVGTERKWNVVVFPSGHGDRAGNRRDVLNSFLMFH